MVTPLLPHTVRPTEPDPVLAAHRTAMAEAAANSLKPAPAHIASERAAGLGRPHGPRHVEFGRGLMLSDPGRFTRPHQTMSSMVLHAIIIAGAVQATAGAAARAVKEINAEDLIFLPKSAVEQPKPEPEKPQDDREVIVSANPPPKGFQTIQALTEVPTTIPPVDINQKALDARNFSGVGAEGGVFSGIVGGTGAVSAEEIATTAYRYEDIDEPATPLFQPSPKYPPQLQAAGIQGSVVLKFIIDTLGKAEPGSLQVEAATHPLFAPNAKDAILGSRFTVAKLNGTKVRQLTKQRLSFVIGN
ncbi:MAG: energy transducer TonB [Gemmatimonadales bacterium]|nr:energy transducer TonB [Gemmatimonadales bacterium]